MMKIAIVENEEIYLTTMLDYSRRFQKEEKTKLEIFTYTNGSDLISEYDNDFDAIFMDIGLPLIDGMEVSKKIRELDDKVLIIFVTNLPQYAIDGYKVDALDFLLKPISYTDFKVEMKKIERNSSNKQKDFLLINNKGILVKVLFNTITYIEVMHHDIIVHTVRNEYKYRGTLKEVEEKLDKSIFSRCNNCFIVNLGFVEKIDKNIVTLESGDNLEISRSRKKPFLDDFTMFINLDVE